MTVSARVVIFGTIITMFCVFETSAQERKEKHLPGIASSYLIGEAPGSTVATIFEH
jgi:hypothetical protein